MSKEWIDIYNESSKLKNVNPDDDTSNSAFKKFFDDLGEKLDSGEYDDVDEKVASDLRKKYEEFSYQFALDPVHVAVYAVNIVCDVGSLLFRAIGLMFENLRPSPKASFEQDYNSDWGSSDKGYENDFGKEKQKGRKKEKDEQTKAKGARRRKYNERDDRDSITAEKDRRQKVAREAVASERNLRQYSASVKSRASRRESSQSEMSDERSMGKF